MLPDVQADFQHVCVSATCLQDEDYEAAGAKLVSAKEAFASSIVLKVRPPKLDETNLFQPESGYEE